MSLHTRMEKLKENISKMENLAVAYSGGVDSSFLLAVSYKAIGDKAIAVTAASPFIPKKEVDEAKRFAKQIGAKHEIVYVNPLEVPEVRNNSVERCYACKKYIFEAIFKHVHKYGINRVVDGSNTDDEGDYRPGMRALKEMGVTSPLRDAGMSKQDIRDISRDMSLNSWNKPALACLATRFPYGEQITEAKLDIVNKAENCLAGMGFRQVRVRYHEGIARIEVAREERSKFFNESMLDKIDEVFKKLGFIYVAFELGGYKTGSMNWGINKVE